MGRHSSDEQAPYYQSILGWALPWVFVAAVAVSGVWVAVNALGRDVSSVGPPRGGSKLAAHASSPASKLAAHMASPASKHTPTPRPAATGRRSKPKATASPTTKPSPAASARPQLITAGITVQVLNGTNVPDAGSRMADRLAHLGFKVWAINPATPYARTTVYWSYPSAAPAARALAARFGWRVGPRPANLSPTVSIHVVVGADEP